MNASGAVALSQLADIAGEANIIRDRTQLVAYQIDGESPSAAVRPGSAEEVAEIVKFAGREKLALVATGARTKLEMGMPPRRYDFALDMTRLDRVAAYDPGDLTLSVEAGTPLRRIAAELAAHGQFLPLEVPFADRATAGGTIASGVDSPLRQAYGTARDFVLGMEFVTGDGAAAKSGGRVVKNVSGYDIHKLMIGSLGTLGVITRINFRTFPLPRTTRTLMAAFRGSPSACAFRKAIAQSVLRPRSLDILRLGAHAGVSFEKDRWLVAVSFSGDGNVLERDQRELEILAEDSGGSSLESFVELQGDAETNTTRFISNFPVAIREPAPWAAIFKISTLPTELVEVARALESIQMPWVVLMRGLGVAYLALMPSDGSEGSLRALKQECARIFGLAGRPPWRHVTLAWCPAALKSEIDVWGPLPADFPLMKKLKAVFDPGEVLSPGRFVGGI